MQHIIWHFPERLSGTRFCLPRWLTQYQNLVGSPPMESLLDGSTFLCYKIEVRFCGQSSLRLNLFGAQYQLFRGYTAFFSYLKTCYKGQSMDHDKISCYLIPRCTFPLKLTELFLILQVEGKIICWLFAVMLLLLPLGHLLVH